MGVHGLWELLAPVGRRVSVETLTGKKLAIDASIWMIQLMKAMRDEKGEMVRNAHLIGFFRRICKLLFLRTKPVFVFDGATPALKRRTVIARRRHRDNAQAKIRKTAEKLLLNHLKAMKLKELASDLEKQKLAKDVKGKKVLSQETGTVDDSDRNNMRATSYNQEELDKLLAASLAAEDDGGLIGNESTSSVGIPSEEDDGDEDEEMILPPMHGKVDPAVLASLPPSMQLDLLVQMRERLMAENRQRYQKVKRAPAKFSELQIQAYLKTLAFRREINEVQKTAVGGGVGGVQTSRIASEANREFIFSSSFTGDKEVLTSAGVEKNGDKQHKAQTVHPSSDSLDSIASTIKSKIATESGSVVDETQEGFDEDVGTYLDERGRVRVSRVRAMGIRMSRDLQRNLDLMKEIEQEIVSANDNTNTESPNEKDLGVSRSVNKDNGSLDALGEGAHETLNFNNQANILIQDDNYSEQCMSKNGISIEISLEDKDEHKSFDGEDDIFARLVAGNSVMASVDDTLSRKLSDSASDFDWEEGIIGERDDFLVDDVNAGTKSSIAKSANTDESEVEWEEGVCDVHRNASPCPAECAIAVSRGVLEEEADIQEAIKRSLHDLQNRTSICQLSGDENTTESREMDCEGAFTENDSAKLNLSLQNVLLQTEKFLGAGDEKLEPEGCSNSLHTSDSPERKLKSSVCINLDKMEVLTDKPSNRFLVSVSEVSEQDAIVTGSLHREIQFTKPVTPIKPTEFHSTAEQLLGNSYNVGQASTLAETYIGVSSTSKSLLDDVPNPALVDADQKDFRATPTCQSIEATDIKSPEVELNVKTIDIAIAEAELNAQDATTDTADKEKWVGEINQDNFIQGKGNIQDEPEDNDNWKVQAEVSEAKLAEEMLILGQERINLGKEQRKLERNAESVSSEMFTECQELLQMFGLPYIIAPMEAEAQCAYMELTKLVDGVVTDDSDVFLFGARSVYKNIFDDRKYVETYFMKDIENELGLTREKIIRMALLLGSDYTEGVSGIGIVNAIEVVNAFPEEDGLKRFREWIESPDPTIFGKVDVHTGFSSRKRGSNVSDNDACYSNRSTGVSASEHSSSQVHEDTQSVDCIQNVKQTFMNKHRNVSKNWHIPSSFPSDAVILAYTSPQVDSSTDPFLWGKPDLFALRKMCWEKFGWGSQKADELLLPVLKEYEKHETQLRLEAFYTFNERFAKIRSRRIKKAVKGITGNQSLELMDDSLQGSKNRKRRKVSPCVASDNKLEKSLDGTEDAVAGKNSKLTGESTPKHSRKRRIHGEPIPSELGNLEPSMQAEGRRYTKKESSGNGRGRRRGKHRGSSDGNGSDDEQYLLVEKLDSPCKVRRSARHRKPVNYIDTAIDIDDTNKSLDQSNEWCKNTTEQELPSEQGQCGSNASVSSEKNQCTAGDTSLGKDLCRGYLEMEGGFCMAEAEQEIEAHQPVLGQNVDSSFDEISKEYLEAGGGFCVEDEMENDPDESASSPPGANICQNEDSSLFFGVMDKTDYDVCSPQLGTTQEIASDELKERQGTGTSISKITHQLNATSTGDRSMLGESLLENKEADPPTNSVRPLSAMPFLRRKQRNG